MEDKRKESLQKLLIYLSKQVTDDDLDTMKFRLHSLETLRGEIDSSKKALELFDVLQKAEKITVYDLKLLKEMLEAIDRTDLFGKVEDFEETLKTIKSAKCNVKRSMLVENFMETDLTRRLNDNMEEERVAIITGSLGSGKSQAAIWYGCHIQERYRGPLVWRMVAKDRSTLLSALLLLRSKLEIEGKQFKEMEDDDDYIVTLAEEISVKLNDLQVSLIILDNVEDVCVKICSKIIPFFTEKLNNKCVVTTINQLAFKEKYGLVHTRGFTKEESLQFLASGKDVLPERRRWYEELARHLSFSPFILHGAKTYMDQSRIGPKEMIKHVKKHCLSLKIKSGTDEETLFGAVKIYIEMLKTEEDKDVFQMFQMLQYFESDNIPICIFHFLPHDSFGKQKILTNALVTAIQKFSFGTVTGEDEYRCIHFHSAVALNLASSTDDVLRKDSLLKLLQSLTWLLDKDNRKSAEDYQRNMSILPHARSIFDHADRSLTNLTFAESLLMVYVSDLIGYTYTFLGQKRLARLYSEKARNMCYSLLDIAVPSTEDATGVEECAKEVANSFYERIKIRHDEHADDLSVLAKNFLLNKHRVFTDLQFLRKVLEVEELDDDPKLTEAEYHQLCTAVSGPFAVPGIHLSILFIFELFIQIMYTYGRNIFYLGKLADEKLYLQFTLHLYLAKYLSMAFEQSDLEAANFRLLYTMLSEQHGTLEIFFENLDQGKTNVKRLRDAISRIRYLLKIKANYFVYGVYKLNSARDTLYQTQGNKQLLRCYTRLLGLTEDENEKCDSKKGGIKCSRVLLQITEDLPERLINRSVFRRVADFYLAISNVEEARKLYEKVCPEDIYRTGVQINTGKPPSHHEMSAAYGLVDCHKVQGDNHQGILILERLKSRLESVPNKGDFSLDLDKIEDLIKAMESVSVQESETNLKQLQRKE